MHEHKQDRAHVFPTFPPSIFLLNFCVLYFPCTYTNSKLLNLISLGKPNVFPAIPPTCVMPPSMTHDYDNKWRPSSVHAAFLLGSFQQLRQEKQGLFALSDKLGSFQTQAHFSTIIHTQRLGQRRSKSGGRYFKSGAMGGKLWFQHVNLIMFYLLPLCPWQT